MESVRPTLWCFAWLAAVGAALVGCADSPSPSSVAKADSPKKVLPEKAEEKPAADQPEPSDIATASDVVSNEVASKELAEAGWGSLKGKFIYDGVAPKPAKINANAGGCNNNNLFDESLVVSPSGELANVIVWVRTPGVKIHSDYNQTKAKAVQIDNKNCRFDPHIVTYWTAQPLELKNSDPAGHNINASLQKNTAFNIIVPGNAAVENKDVKVSETLPVPMQCNIHKWMNGFLVVQDHPYMSVSADDGTFELNNLPIGELEFQVWHEKAGYVREVDVNGKPTEWKRGRVTLTIKPGENDLGVVKVPASLFNK